MKNTILALVLIAVFLSGFLVFIRPIEAATTNPTVQWNGVSQSDIVFQIANPDGNGYFYHSVYKAAQANGFTNANVTFLNPAVLYTITYWNATSTRTEVVYEDSIHSITVSAFRPSKLEQPVIVTNEISVSTAFGDNKMKDAYAYIEKTDGSGQYERHDFNVSGFGVENKFGSHVANKIWYGYITNYGLGVIYYEDSLQLYTEYYMPHTLASFNYTR